MKLGARGLRAARAGCSRVNVTALALQGIGGQSASLGLHSASAAILGSSPVSVTGATAISTPVSVGCSGEADEHGFLGEVRVIRLWDR